MAYPKLDGADRFRIVVKGRLFPSSTIPHDDTQGRVSAYFLYPDQLTPHELAKRGGSLSPQYEALLEMLKSRPPIVIIDDAEYERHDETGVVMCGNDYPLERIEYRQRVEKDADD